MQTPSHVAISLLVWRKVPNWKCALAVVFGALLPDLAMFVFYGFQKMIGSAEADIWGSYYFLDHWQFVFDLFNSIPVFLVVAVICHRRGYRIGFLIAASAIVHVLCDLPLHNDDAHRHFLPFTNWRFISPVSYWDPKHFGVYAMITELLIAVSACICVVVGKNSKSIKVAGWVTLSIYFAGMAMAVWLWSQWRG